MINNISWASYSYAIVILLVFYYLVVLVFFYKKDIGVIYTVSQKFLFPGLSEQIPEGWEVFSENDYDLKKESLDQRIDSEFQVVGDDLFRLIQSLQDEMEAYFSDASKLRTNKSEIIFSIQQLLSKYPHPGIPTYRISLNKFIENSLTKYCSIRLTEEEMKQLWKD